MKIASNNEYKYDLKIPKERVAVLIGTKGETKRLIESETKTKVEIDSEEGDVDISGKDSLLLFSAREVVTAIGRGFNPKIALKLMKIDYAFDLMNVGDIAKSKNDLIRMNGRIIGQEGKSRRIIEELTECDICVYGKTVGVIGKIEMVPIARRAIEMLLNGSTHSNVFKYLETQRRNMKMQEFEAKNS